MGLLLKGMALFAGCTLMLSSCNKDDDDNNGGGGSNVAGNSTSLVKDGKMLLTSIDHNDGSYTYTTVFAYDERLRPVYAKDSYGDYHFYIDYKTGKITYDGIENLSVSFNKNGYITKIQGSWNYNDEDGIVRGSLSYTFSYDKSGHLISANVTGEEYEKDDYETYYYKVIGKSVSTWSNGNLMKVENNYVVYDEKGNIEEKGEETQTYTYSEKTNKYKQYGIDTDIFYQVGLLGVGSEMLPLTMSYSYVDEDEDGIKKGDGSRSYEFKLKENGSINTQTIKYSYSKYPSTYKFNYTPTDEYDPELTRAGLSSYKAKSEKADNKKHLINLLKKRRMHKHIEKN